MNKKYGNRGKCLNYYNYEVIVDGEKWRFKNRQEIKDAFGMSMSSIRNIMLNLHQTDYYLNKWKNFEIKKIHIKIKK